MASSWSVAREELSCPVCRDIFNDPVLLPCSHSFCRDCVLTWWATKRIRQCPVCKKVAAAKSPPRNLVLRNLSEAFSLEVNSGVLCALHTERLKLFCLDHWAPVCVVCRDSKKHRNHTFIPVEEAAESSRVVIREHLRPLREKAKLFNEVKLNWAKRDEEIESQARDMEVKIREEFAVLREFLSREEELRVAAVMDEKEQKRKTAKGMVAVLTGQISELESTITSMEGGLRDDDVSLLTRVHALEKEAGRPLPEDPQRDTGAPMDVAKYLGNMSFYVWCKMKEMVSYTPVILDPNTAHRELHLSEGLTNARCGPGQPLAAAPGRMEQHRSVLGSEGFSSGRHSWDVEVGGNRVWALGVIAQGARRTGDVPSGLWAVRFCNGRFSAFSPSCPASVLPLKDRVQRVRVQLDWGAGELSFSDPDADTVMHTFTHAFTDRLYPYVNTWDGLPLKILPMKVSVTIT